MSEWISVKDRMPPEGILVQNKIDDKDGEGNIAMLERKGRLWVLPSGMYVYYTPTHWREQHV